MSPKNLVIPLKMETPLFVTVALLVVNALLTKTPVIVVVPPFKFVLPVKVVPEAFEETEPRVPEAAFKFANVAVPVAVMLVPVAFVNSRFVIYPVTADNTFVTKFPEFEMFCEVVVPVKLRLLSSVIVVVDTLPFTVEVIKFAPVEVE
jgi:hypothetical protein